MCPVFRTPVYQHTATHVPDESIVVSITAVPAKSNVVTTTTDPDKSIVLTTTANLVENIVVTTTAVPAERVWCRCRQLSQSPGEAAGGRETIGLQQIGTTSYRDDIMQ